jgi:membrane-bound lytic murein transglycosylase D
MKAAPVLILAIAVMSGGCSIEEPPPEAVPVEHLALYEMIHVYRQDHERALGQIVAGDEVAGRNLLAASTDRLAVAAEVCARTPGCDTRLFAEATRQVLLDRSAAIESHEAVRIDTSTDSPLIDAVPEIGRTVALLNGSDLRELIPVNTPVRAALNDWLTWNRPAFVDAYDNYQFLRVKIAPVYEEAGLPEALLFAMMAKETGGKVHAYSRAGAAGPLQFMSRTGRRYGLGAIDGFDMRLDPVAATRANVAYLNDLFRIFNNDLEMAVAAYNVGDGKLRRLDRRNGETEFWDPALYYSLPTETRDYVPQVFAAALLFLYPEEYGLKLPDHETTHTTVVIGREISLGELSICLGQEHNRRGWFRTLRNLNPRVNPADRLEAGTSIEMPSLLVPVYVDRCLGDSELVRLARDLHDASYPDDPEWVHYKVRSGDTLAGIAARHPCISVGRIANINGIRPPDFVIHPGQDITIPGCS